MGNDLSYFLQLKTEVFQLAKQLEEARSEIEDLRRMVGAEKQGEKEKLSTETVEFNVCYIHLLVLLKAWIFFFCHLLTRYFPGSAGTTIPQAASAQYMGL